MEALIVDTLARNAPIAVIVGLGFWRVLVALHKIDKRLVRVETKLEED
jgi:hypothetical protein